MSAYLGGRYGIVAFACLPYRTTKLLYLAAPCHPELRRGYGRRMGLNNRVLIFMLTRARQSIFPIRIPAAGLVL